MTHVFAGNQLLPQAVVDTNEEIKSRYHDIELVIVNNHVEQGKPPFALVNIKTGDLIRYFKETEIHFNNVLQWIYDNDSQRHGEKALWDKFQATVEAEKAERENSSHEKLMEKADLISTMQKSHLNVFKHGGRKFGA